MRDPNVTPPTPLAMPRDENPRKPTPRDEPQLGPPDRTPILARTVPLIQEPAHLSAGVELPPGLPDRSTVPPVAEVAHEGIGEDCTCDELLGREGLA